VQKECKVKLSGRLGGSEMARSEMYKKEEFLFTTLRADIDYALSEAKKQVYGIIGIKVVDFQKEVYERETCLPNSKVLQLSQKPKKLQVLERYMVQDEEKEITNFHP